MRREILRLIWDQELPAGEIAAAFALTKPTISQHLGVLRRAGLVTMTATGTFRRYRARQEVLQRLNGALVSDMKWTTADDLPERELSEASTKLVVVATVDVETDQEATFKAFVDPVAYSRWLGVPVTIENGRFACTLEWGTSVRGRYELVCPSGAGRNAVGLRGRQRAGSGRRDDRLSPGQPFKQYDWWCARGSPPAGGHS